ncbi:HEPN domain-containing protein [Micromonospora sp. 4G57]|uniref:HEPN domain-containing protein n=1 Tax=Micromonospora sicca TaxID=2202420 RepID=A0ABU5JPY1_9ACTN|nr:MULTISPECIES: HEPN domain-containing protein [unclassified Micromonospora]MDZ5447922.1 HEPN domain-containing protein [Micromonospora sp. 4G57]MDZ5494666.1 HEPN domain-containing protein [Micromonospora sp. 4G53]
MSTAALALSASVFGNEFVRWVLNAEASPMAADALTPEQNEAVEELARLAAPMHETPPLPGRWAAFVVISHAYEVIAALRARCGATVLDLDSDDEVEQILIECVARIFPALVLAAPPQDSFSIGVELTSAAIEFAGERLGMALLRDAALRRLFVDPVSPESGEIDAAALDRIIANHWWASAGGGTAFPRIVAGQLVAFGVLRASFDPRPTIDDAIRYAREGLRIARELATGKTAEIPVIVGLSNVAFSTQDTIVDTPWGSLQVPGAIGRALLHAPGPASARQHRDVSLAWVTSSQENLVRIAYRWPNDQDDHPKSWWAKYSQQVANATAQVNDGIGRLRFSMLLASEPGTIAAAAAESRVALSPLTMVTTLPLGATGPLPTPEAVISKDTAEMIKSWSESVAAQHPASLDIGLRRILSAVAVRLDVLDGFIDAVMCWENMFGAANDTSFKVCGSLAKLLEPDDDEARQVLFARLVKLYDTRSKLVHGAKEPRADAAVSLRDDAVDIALRAFRAAYSYPGLLSLKDSVQRSKRVMLGFAGD